MEHGDQTNSSAVASLRLLTLVSFSRPCPWSFWHLLLERYSASLGKYHDRWRYNWGSSVLTTTTWRWRLHDHQRGKTRIQQWRYSASRWQCGLLPEWGNLYCPLPDGRTFSKSFPLIVSILYLVNSAVNPVAYSLYKSDIKKVIGRMVCRARAPRPIATVNASTVGGNVNSARSLSDVACDNHGA